MQRERDREIGGRKRERGQKREGYRERERVGQRERKREGAERGAGRERGALSHGCIGGLICLPFLKISRFPSAGRVLF